MTVFAFVLTDESNDVFVQSFYGKRCQIKVFHAK